jgi:alanyl-tRNA synthetase
LDISHFKRIEPKELRDIERLANQVVMENRPVKIEWMDRNIAERKYGFDLYQGGVVPGKKVRVVDIEGWNTQACAGTHYLRTGEVGFIKVLRTERIQDGVERLEFAAGEPALRFVHAQEEQLANAAEILRTAPEHLVGATQQLFDQWKSTKKEVDRLRERLAMVRLEELKAKAESIGRVRLVKEKFDVESVDELIKIAGAVTRENADMVVAFTTIAEQPPVIVIMAGEEAVKAGINCAEIAAEAARVLGGGGGGKPEMGQGGGPDLAQLDAALGIVVDMCELQQAR